MPHPSLVAVPRQLTITEAISKLQVLQAELNKAQDDYRTTLDALANARADLRRDHSRAFMDSDGPQDQRRKNADYETWMTYQASELAEAAMWAAQSKVSIIKEQMGAMRTIISALRAEFAAEPTGQWS